MARYISDQNKVLLIHESGTYAVPSGNGVWIGEVTEHSIDDTENKLVNRYMGTASRSFGGIEKGPRDVTGVLTYNVQNFRLPFFAIGSTYSESGTAIPTSTHTTTQINTDVRQSAWTSGPLNPPISFTIEDSKQATGTGRNFIRTINGCVPNTVTISATRGEKVTAEIDYMGQTLTVSSGTTTSLTEDTTIPYLWDSSTLTVGGSVLDTTKEISLEINQNLEGPHYLNGSRDIGTPFPGNREYTLSITSDMDSNNTDNTYNDLFKSNTTFNATWDLDQDTTTGSQHTIIVMSGCKVVTYDVPSTSEGLTESTIEVQPQNVSATEYTSPSLFGPF